MINDFGCVYVSFDRLALKEKSLLKLSESHGCCATLRFILMFCVVDCLFLWWSSSEIGRITKSCAVSLTPII